MCSTKPPANRSCGSSTAAGASFTFLDGQNDAENLALLDKTAGGTLSPLRLESKQAARNIPGGAQQVQRGDFKSKYLRLFRGSQRANLSLLQFYEYYHAAATGSGNVLLTYADGSPAMAVSNAGQGTLLLCNFSVNELASNMARQRAFPAWIQDLVKTLGSEENTETEHEIGDQIEGDVWKTEMSEGSVRAPSGQAHAHGAHAGYQPLSHFFCHQRTGYLSARRSGHTLCVGGELPG